MYLKKPHSEVDLILWIGIGNIRTREKRFDIYREMMGEKDAAANQRRFCRNKDSQYKGYG
jgi:hypothetical protein